MKNDTLKESVSEDTVNDKHSFDSEPHASVQVNDSQETEGKQEKSDGKQEKEEGKLEKNEEKQEKKEGKLEKQTTNEKLSDNDDFSTPHRMSKSAFVVICYNELKRYLSYFFIILVLTLFKPKEEISFLEAIGKISLVFGLFTATAVVTAFLNYYFKRFYVKDGNLIFMHGILRRQTTSIPVYKIHSMRTKRGLVYRLLDMKGVSFDTLASKTEEIELILDDADWNSLLSLVEAQEQHAKGNETNRERAEEEIQTKYEELTNGEIRLNEAQLDEVKSDENKSDKIESDKAVIEKKHNLQIIKFSNFNLIKGAFCQNHLKGMTILASALFAFFGKISDYFYAAIEYTVDYLESNLPETSFSITAFISFLIVIYLFIMILWIGKVFLRYFNMEVRMDKTQLFFESGLFTRQSSQFSYDKVCTVYVKQNILEKWTNSCTLNLKQAFNATNKKDESDVKIYGSNSSKRFLDWWLGKDFALSKEIISAHSGKGLFGFTIKNDFLISIAALIVLGHFELYIWMTIPILYMLVSLAKGMCAVYHGSISLRDDYLVINTGHFADIQNYVKYSNIEVVRMVQTPFTPFFHRVNLVIATNGTSFVVRSLKIQEAKDIYELLLCYCRNER